MAMAVEPADISMLVVFGDSLSDNGNLFKQFGISLPFAWEGRDSNGPVYAEQLAQLLGVQLDDRAFAGAEASDFSPPVLPVSLPINLPEQVAGYIAQLGSHSPPLGTTALINIGGNDYEGYLRSDLPKDPLSIHNFVASVAGSIAQAIDSLTNAGVEKVILFTLPDLGAAAALFGAPAQAVALLHGLALANNAALEQIAASHPKVEIVDAFQLSEALFADPQSFGFSAPLTDTWSNQLLAGSTQFAPNEVALFDTEHPTTAAHSVIAAFADAVLTSDHVQLIDGTSDVHAQNGNDFIFATNNALQPVVNHKYTIYGGSGTDLIFTGPGDVTVYGGSGTDLIAAGSGNATLVGGNGTDVLETNSTGTNLLVGGHGADAFIVNRGGTNTLQGGTGDDLFILKEGASLFNPINGTPHFAFGPQVITGGKGGGTLLFIINDQNPIAENALRGEFQNVVSAFNMAITDHHSGSFQVDGLTVTGITGLELQIDSLSSDPHTPYLITHNVVQIVGQAPEISSDLGGLLHTADIWNLLAV
jgi:phospholipase/lecithinase/hemolysin